MTVDAAPTSCGDGGQSARWRLRDRLFRFADPRVALPCRRSGGERPRSGPIAFNGAFLSCRSERAPSGCRGGLRWTGPPRPTPRFRVASSSTTFARQVDARGGNCRVQSRHASDPDASYDDYRQRGVGALRAPARRRGRGGAGRTSFRRGGFLTPLKERRQTPDWRRDFVAATGSISSPSASATSTAPREPRCARPRPLESDPPAVDVPLALHGGTGIADESLRAAAALGVGKVNFLAGLKLRYLEAVRRALASDVAHLHVLLGMGGLEDVTTGMARGARSGAGALAGARLRGEGVRDDGHGRLRGHLGGGQPVRPDRRPAAIRAVGDGRRHSRQSGRLRRQRGDLPRTPEHRRFGRRLRRERRRRASSACGAARARRRLRRGCPRRGGDNQQDGHPAGERRGSPLHPLSRRQCGAHRRSYPPRLGRAAEGVLSRRLVPAARPRDRRAGRSAELLSGARASSP